MRAIIVATGYQEQLSPLIHQRPSPLFKVADKPILFHLLEYLSHHSIEDVDIVLHHLPEMIREKLGSGKRWGLRIHYHLARDPDYPLSSLKAVVSEWKEQAVIVVPGESLPIGMLDLDQDSCYFEDTQSGGHPWLLIQASQLAELDRSTTWEEIPEKLSLKAAPYQQAVVTGVRSMDDLQELNHRFLKKELPELIPPATAKYEPTGNWISSSASIHPTTQIKAPVFIGRNCQIAANSVIGPGTIIESNSIVDDHTLVEDSLICQNSYVGQHLNIQNSIIDRQWVLNLKHRTQLEIHDEWIIDHLHQPSLRDRVWRYFQQACAGLLLLLLSPVLLLIWTLAELQSSTRVLMPVRISSKDLPTFKLWSFHPRHARVKTWIPKACLKLPSLFNILCGELHFVGLTPKRPQRVKDLPFDWQTLYLDSKPGLFTLAELEHGSSPSLDDEYVSEVYYVAKSSPLYDLHILWRYFKRCWA